MRRFLTLLVTLVVFGVGSALGQVKQVTGVVTSADDKQPIPGVNITIKEVPGVGVVTDIDGKFTLKNVPAGAKNLVVSFIGYETQTLPLSSSINVVLVSDNKKIDEVVVVGYGVKKKGTITGSVSTVSAEKIDKMPVASFDQALQGQSAGLQVMTSSGEPGAVSSVRIRGISSINAGTSPLYVMDGVQITEGVFSSLNPSDIASVSVLKDASSTSIYGARAANGVIVITTKRGKTAEKSRINFRSQYGISRIAYGKFDMMNTSELLAYELKHGKITQATVDKYKDVNVNWKDVLFKDNAKMQSHEVSITGGNAKTLIYASGGYYEQEGIAPRSNFKRYTARLNMENQANQWVKVGFNTALGYEKKSNTNNGRTSTTNPAFGSLLMKPYWNPYRADGSIASVKDKSFPVTNPLEMLRDNKDNRNLAKLVGSAYVQIEPVKNLIFKTLGGIDAYDYRKDSVSLPSFAPNKGKGANGETFEREYRLMLTNTVNYSKKIGEAHNLNFLLGQEATQYYTHMFRAGTSGLVDDRLTMVNAGATPEAVKANTQEYTYSSLFGRAEYNYLGKYYGDFSLRRDGSSRFGKDVKYANFWSVGFMWDMKKEAFLENSNVLTYSQLSASIGTSGNSDIDNYSHLALVSSGLQYNGQTGFAPSVPGNSNLTWEKVIQQNLTWKAEFYKRANLTVELYRKVTSDMLMEIPYSLTSGFESGWGNIGKMVNKGVDIDFSVDIVRGSAFKWNFNTNFSYNKNEITELYNGKDEYVIPNTGLKLKVGHAYGEYYDVRFAGVNPATGAPQWYDANGKITEQYSDDAKVFLGRNQYAPYSGGFTNTFTYKDFTLTVFFSWVKDRYIMNNNRYFTESNGQFNFNQSRKMLNEWQKPGDITDVPVYGSAPQMDSRIIEDASFLRLKNLNFSYQLPKKILTKLRYVDGVRVYVQGQNLLTFTKYTGYDPEDASNVALGRYPQSKQLTFGIDVNF